MKIIYLNKFPHKNHRKYLKRNLRKKKSIKIRLIDINLTPFTLWSFKKKLGNGVFFKNFRGDVMYVNSFFLRNPFKLFFLLDFYKNLSEWGSCFNSLFFLKYNSTISTLFYKKTRSFYGNSFKSKLRYLSKDSSFFYFNLPSGLKKRFSVSLYFFYTDFNIYRPKNRKFSVRGIAKNCVDHPNGGNSNTRSPFKTPWGKVAKFGR